MRRWLPSGLSRIKIRDLPHSTQVEKLTCLLKELLQEQSANRPQNLSIRQPPWPQPIWFHELVLLPVTETIKETTVAGCSCHHVLKRTHKHGQQRQSTILVWISLRQCVLAWANTCASLPHQRGAPRLSTGPPSLCHVHNLTETSYLTWTHLLILLFISLLHRFAATLLISTCHTLLMTPQLEIKSQRISLIVSPSPPHKPQKWSSQSSKLNHNIYKDIHPFCCFQGCKKPRCHDWWAADHVASVAPSCHFSLLSRKISSYLTQRARLVQTMDISQLD